MLAHLTVSTISILQKCLINYTIQNKENQEKITKREKKFMKTELYARFIEYYGRMPKSRKEFARFVLFVRGAL